MRRVVRLGFACLALLLLLSPTTALAQSTPIVTVFQNSVAAAANGATMLVSGASTLGVQITTTGAPTFSVTFQGAASDTPSSPAAFSPVNCYPANGTAFVTTASATGLWRCNVSGLTSFQVPINSLTGVGTVRIVGNLITAGTDGSISASLAANPVPATQGGTGLTAYTIGDLISAPTATTLATVHDVAVDHVLVSGGVGVLPAWSSYQLGNRASAPPSPSQGASWWLHPTQNYLLGYDGTGWQSDAALATKVINTADSRWGCTFDQVTDDAACINAAIAAAPTIVGPGDMGTRGGAIVLVPRQALIKSTIKVPGQNAALSITLQCAGMYTSGFIWGGGNTADIVTINRADNANTSSHAVRGCGFFNKSTSGTGLTAVRATNINGIRFGDSLVGTSGQNDILIEQNGFFYLDNGVITNNVTGPVNITIRKNLFSLLYNQTSPVVNPVTDAPVTAHGNAVFFGTGTLPQGIYLYDNDATVQNWLLDAQGANGVPNLVAIGNFEQSTNAFSGGPGGIRTASSGSFLISGNQLNARSGSFALDLGTTALGGSGVSGGMITGNEFDGLSGAGTGLRLTFADGVTITGNTFFNLGTAITWVGANVKTPLLGVNHYNTVTTKLSDGGAVNRTILDQQIGVEFAGGVFAKTGAGIGGTPSINNTLKMYGTTSGAVTVNVSAVAGAATVTIPSTTGTLITTGDSGTVTSTMLGITTTSCTNQVVTAISAGGVGTCSSVSNAMLAGSIALSNIIGAGTGRIPFAQGSPFALTDSSELVFTVGTSLLTLTSAASQNATFTLDGSTSNGFGAQAKFKTKTAGGVAQEFDVGMGITSSSVWDLWDATNSVSLLAATIGGGVRLGSTAGSAPSLVSVTQLNLPAAANGTILYCSDCNTASACTAGGTGAFASRQNGAWKCL